MKQENEDYVIDLIKQNEKLKKANEYNESLINVFKDWFKSINGIERISTRKDYYSEFPFDKSLKPRMIEIHTVSFPDLRYGFPFDDDLIETLAYATGVLTDCNICNNGNKITIYGEPMNFCPKCGRALNSKFR